MNQISGLQGIVFPAGLSRLDLVSFHDSACCWVSTLCGLHSVDVCAIASDFCIGYAGQQQNHQSKGCGVSCWIDEA